MNNFLLVRLSSMGDLIHTFPAITDLAHSKSNISLSWLCEEAFADIASLHPFIQHVYPMNGRKWHKNWFKKQTREQMTQLKKQLRSENFDGVIDSQGLIKSAYYARFAKAPVHGPDRNSAREGLASLLYQHTYAVSYEQPAITRYRQLFAQIFQYPVPETCNFGIRVPEISAQFDWLDIPYAVLLHATSQSRKFWPQSHWQELAKLLWLKKGLVSFLPWGNEKEHQQAQNIAQSFEYIKICPKLTLKEMAVFLNSATCIAGVDTGLLHLANALDKPLCGIYTDTDPSKTGVVETEKSVNIGSIGIIPQAVEVFEKLNIMT